MTLDSPCVEIPASTPCFRPEVRYRPPGFRPLLLSSLVAWLTASGVSTAQLPREPPELGKASVARASESIQGQEVLLAGPRSATLEAGEALAVLAAGPAAWPSGPEKARGDVLIQFAGFTGSGGEALAVGPRDLLQVTDNDIWIWSREGAFRRVVTLWSFFSPLMPGNWSSFSTDFSQIHYSREHNRFVLVTAGLEGPGSEVAQAGVIFLAVSRSADPAEGWWQYRIDPPGGGLLDQLSVALDNWGVYVTADFLEAGSTFQGAYLWSLGLSPLEGGVASAWRSVPLTWPDGSLARGVRAAVPHSTSSEDTTFFLNTRGSAGSEALMWRLTGDRVLSPALIRIPVSVPRYHPVGDGIRQRGSSARIDGGDASAYHVIYGYRRLYAVWTSAPSAAAESSDVVSIKIDTNRAVVITEHTISGGEDWYYFNPSLIVNGGSAPALETIVVYAFSHPDLAYPST
ncbi:MAG: hypothetical protein MI919_36205, partial [Holophagales bacterium]|nr:hypothetical protein [Holophagales bacterium]